VQKYLRGFSFILIYFLKALKLFASILVNSAYIIHQDDEIAGRGKKDEEEILVQFVLELLRTNLICIHFVELSTNVTMAAFSYKLLNYGISDGKVIV
jgi:hypothetical protein